MPSWLDCQAHAVAGLTDPAGFGLSVTLTPTAGAPVTCLGMVDSAVEPLNPFDTTDERRWTAWLPTAALDTQPTSGDVITTEQGETYEVTGDAEWVDGLWRCAVVPTDAPVLPSLFEPLYVSDGAGGYQLLQVPDGADWQNLLTRIPT